MSDEIKKEETNIEREKESPELSDEQVEGVSAGFEEMEIPSFATGAAAQPVEFQEEDLSTSPVRSSHLPDIDSVFGDGDERN